MMQFIKKCGTLRMLMVLSLLVTGLLGGTAIAQSQQVYATSSDGFLNVREEPRGDAFVVDVLFTGGEGAKLIERRGNWLKIEHQGQKGYVVERYATVASKRPNIKPYTGKLHYVVVQSFADLDAAKRAAENMPDILLSPVYRAVDNDGSVKYRICTMCFRTQAKAKEYQRELKELGWESWVWTNNGFADCVYRPGSLYDGAIAIAPLVPHD